jgi:LysR family nitrogen assimilation transcriptional regulator
LVIGASADFGARSTLSNALISAGHHVRIAAEVNTAGASKSLVLENVGPTVHVAAMARAEILRGELRALPIRGLYSTRVLAFSAKSEITTPVHEMMQAVKDCLGELTATGKWPLAEMIAS